jgi:Spy/CpxP family protein refolding chaperone
MKKATIAILLMLVVAVSVALAQGPPPGPPDPATRVQHRVKYLTTVLSLSAAQQQQATTIFTNAANSAESLHQSMRTAHQNLDTAVKNNDSAAIDQAANTVGNLMGQMTAIHAKADAAFRQILTPDQVSKLNELKDEGPGFGKHMMFGPGRDLH